MKLECIHADTCLPDYWGGHHLPHVQIPVDGPMTFKAIREAIRSELRQGAVMGSSDDARLLSADVVRQDEEMRANQLTRAAYAAVNRDIRPAKKGARLAFQDIEPSTDGDDSVYAYFVFREA